MYVVESIMLTPLPTELIRDRSQQRGVASVVPQPTIPQVRRTPVRQIAEQPERIVHPRLLDAAGHDRFVATPVPQQSNPRANAKQTGRLERIATARQIPVVLVPEPHTDNSAAGGADAVCDEHGETAVPRDESDG